MKDFQQLICPKCHSAPLKSWNELNGEQKFLVERLLLNADYTLAERKKHRFCERCWFEQVENKIENV